MSQKIVTADDGGLANEVGEWAVDKHKILSNYVGVTSAVRKKFLRGAAQSATYIDLYSAMGRSKIRNTETFIEGSSIAAWNESVTMGAPFSDVIIADLDQQAVNEFECRLKRSGAAVKTFVGRSDETVHQICDSLNPYGYHFAFLDPYNLATLPFSVIERLTRVRHMDLLIHVSSHDLQRNFGQCLSGKQEGLDVFCPGWRDVVNSSDKESTQRTAVFNYWRQLISDTGKITANGIEHITGSKKQTLYWLVLASGSEVAEMLWDKVRDISPQNDLFG